MPTEAAAAGAFVVALLTVLAATLVAIRVAHRLSFYDQPGGYKAHRRSTPYLGGAAVVAGFSLAAVLFVGVDRRLFVILGGAFLLLAVGTVDDRRTVRPSVRLATTGAAAVLLFASGIGWSIFNSEAANVALSVVWVIGLVNAFNLMDNMDGAAATVAAVSAMGVAVVAASNDHGEVAVLAFAVAGACVGFLRYNLTSPARIFLGDGGSMPLGFVLAAATMSVPELSDGGVSTLIPAALLVGLAIFDTTLVIVSRSRRRVRIYAGGRDHMTHRLLPLLRSPRAVAGVLALAQASLCALAVTAVAVGTWAGVVLAVSCASIGAIVLGAFERMSAWPAPARGGASVGGPAVVSAVEDVTTHGYQESDHPRTLTPID